MIKHIIWSSMVDYPGNICTVMFTGNCNFNCEYCYNKTLKNMPDLDFNGYILPKLIERREFIDHIIISGGEPTIEDNFENIVNTLYENGFKIGIHTNGTNPDKLQKVLPKLDYVGMDIKTSKENYEKICKVKTNIENISNSMNIIINSGISYEFRTTAFPDGVGLEDVKKICHHLKNIGAKTYHLQQFYPTDDVNYVKQYSADALNEFANECNNILPTILKTK